MNAFLIFLLVIVLVFFIAILLGTFLPSSLASSYQDLLSSKNKSSEE